MKKNNTRTEQETNMYIKLIYRWYYPAMTMRNLQDLFFTSFDECPAFDNCMPLPLPTEKDSSQGIRSLIFCLFKMRQGRTDESKSVWMSIKRCTQDRRKRILGMRLP
jgi:hypothetical protein